MGLDANGVKFLAYAYRLGVDFSRTATVGRQSLSADARSVGATFRAAGRSLSKNELQKITSNPYGEDLLRSLGAESVVSFDASDYEEATEVHDFNLPIDDRFKERFTVVLDGGTLEHIFNFPTALKNCMEMTAKEGHFLAITPANNFLGHGFYQFSPELHFGVFNDVNGFDVVDLIFFEDHEGAPWYRVRNPKEVAGRVTLENARPAYLLVIAKRTAVKPIFTEYPQQSDYSQVWQGNGAHTLPRARSVFSRAPGAILRRIRRVLGGSGMRFEPEQFVRFEPFE